MLQLKCRATLTTQHAGPGADGTPPELLWQRLVHQERLGARVGDALGAAFASLAPEEQAALQRVMA